MVDSLPVHFSGTTFSYKHLINLPSVTPTSSSSFLLSPSSIPTSHPSTPVLYPGAPGNPTTPLLQPYIGPSVSFNTRSGPNPCKTKSEGRKRETVEDRKPVIIELRVNYGSKRRGSTSREGKESGCKRVY